jgi:hypothetical protein
MHCEPAINVCGIGKGMPPCSANPGSGPTRRSSMMQNTCFIRTGHFGDCVAFSLAFS